MTRALGTAQMEHTTTVVIGSGLSGLAVASELSRQGVESIVVDQLELFGVEPVARKAELAEPGSLAERGEILRVLRHYASSHSLDVRTQAKATELSIDPEKPQQWVIRTSEGVLLAENVVLTRCAQSQLRRFLASLGISIGKDVVNALHALGLYLVGVGDALLPSTKDILRQAKNVSQAISTQSQLRQNALA
ncbi:2-polyprenyl-6-methoxyphenol hydroxylase-like FAD-dependent oxidoreductase [Psychromicrobium silvestre]|uniref:2-polyprenyl-6-methoxyphenol hydroxylase-like FAD-dependent oxidoreductase n=1 Tax=Psychromicrobium silvestre TaxID=1645614 RepID=A0A7Y9S8M2_9MICC|nr:FAD-dependent monooxygenase [Psychromicrobium silvestre]NYE96126.1 2-polyprenyl-6-methoxyphenol hydroxylase-like FAD-dependent oxidoreductase [Psychromicrobium silvestre]